MSTEQIRPPTLRCHRCKLLRLGDERWKGGYCPDCRTIRGAQQRKAAATKVLARAISAGTETRDGQTFRVVQLPSTRRGRRR